MEESKKKYMGDFRETAFNYIVGENFGTFFTAEQKWINKINSLAEKYPEEVNIKHINSDGSIIVHIPRKWFKISPPRSMSEEQKQAASERFKQMWADRNDEEIEDD